MRSKLWLCLLLAFGCDNDAEPLGTLVEDTLDRAEVSALDVLVPDTGANTFDIAESVDTLEAIDSTTSDANERLAADTSSDLSDTPEMDTEEPPDTSVPVEPSNLRLNHLQALGTHNSYHKKPFISDFVYQWDYEHLPLDEQMGLQGIRQFELDAYYDASEGVFDVYHVAVIDQETTCATMVECIQVIKSWSDTHLEHHPFVVLVELKTDYNEAEALDMLNTLDDAILSVWPEDRLVTPDLVQGDYDNVRDALAGDGWPRIDDVRGRGLFVLHAGGQFASTYTEGGATTAGRPMFPDAYGNLDLPYAAVHSMNDPKSGFDSIQQVVSAGHIVRTRSDSNSDEPNAGDYSRYEAALDSGAHFISTDYPGEPYGDEWAVNIPGGTPSRCNPISAPDECTPEAIEFGQLDL